MQEVWGSITARQATGKTIARLWGNKHPAIKGLPGLHSTTLGIPSGPKRLMRVKNKQMHGDPFDFIRISFTYGLISTTSGCKGGSRLWSFDLPQGVPKGEETMEAWGDSRLSLLRSRTSKPWEPALYAGSQRLWNSSGGRSKFRTPKPPCSHDAPSTAQLPAERAGGSCDRSSRDQAVPYEFIGTLGTNDPALSKQSEDKE